MLTQLVLLGKFSAPTLQKGVFEGLIRGQVLGMGLEAGVAGAAGAGLGLLGQAANEAPVQVPGARAGARPAAGRGSRVPLWGQGRVQGSN